MKRIIAMLLACFLMVMCFAACSSADTGSQDASDAEETSDTAEGTETENETEQTAADGGTTLRAVLNADISTMDCKDTTKDYFIPMNINDRLFDVEVFEDGSNEIVNSLCESYTVSEDGLTYTLHLVEGVEFSNGEPLTAEDVVFTFEHLLAPDSVNADIPGEVLGAQAYMDGEADSVEGLTIEDDYTVTITLEAANAGFIAELTSAQMGILDKTTTEAASNFGIDVSETIGCGPYIVTEWVNNDHITLVRNENYWGELPGIETCIIYIIPDNSTQNLMYQNGELDIIDLDYIDSSIVAATYLTEYADNIVYRDRAALTMMVLNANDEYLSDVNVRKAIQMAIDRQTIIDTVFNGLGHVENGIIPTGVVGHNDNGTEIVYDPDAARALLEEAGYEDGQISIEMAYDASASTNVQLVYQIVEQELEEIGINVEIKTYDESSWLATRKSGEMCSFISTWTMDYNDPANIMVTFFGNESNTTLRSLNYADTDVMARVSAASSIIDDDERYAEYQTLEEIIVHEDAALVPLYETTHLFAVSDNVESFTPHWAGYGDYYIADVTLG